MNRVTKAIGRAALGALWTVALLAMPRAEAAGLLIADGGLGGELKIIEHTAHVTINNGIAVTEVTQVFQNQENRQVEALYTFPVPAKASVSNFSMWIGGTEMVGEVVEKERAREIYNSYKQRKRDPGLLEQVDYKTFEMRIFPIEALAEQRVQITYYQQLDFDADWATYVYPLATNGAGQAQRVEGKFGLTVDIRSEVPIVDVESPSHRDDFIMATHADTYHEASLEQTEGDLARDLVVAYQVARPRTGIDIVTSKTGNEDGYFYLTLTPGEELSGDSLGADYVFVLDISGSMGSDGKLELSRNSIGAFVDALGDNDRFEVLTFNVQPITLFSELVAVDDTAKSRAQEFLRSQRAAGGTSLQSALRTSVNYAEPNGDRQLNIVVLSDGMAKDEDRRALQDAAAAKPPNARIFCVGVGNDINRPLLTQIAEQTGGMAAFLSRGDDFERQAQAFRRKLTRPVATDLAIDFRGLEVYDVEPTTLPNLYHGMPIRLFGRYKGAGPVSVNLKADVEGVGLDQTVDFTFPDSDDTNPEIERMWAWNRATRLIEADKDSGSRSNLDEIVRLGEGYSIVTEYTSFLVLENDSEYQRWNIDRKNALRIDRDRRAQKRVRDQLDAMKTRAAADLGPDKPAEVVNRPEKSAPKLGPVEDTLSRQRPGDIAMPRTQSRPSSNGSGAIDPITGMLALGAAGMAWLRRTKKA